MGQLYHYMSIAFAPRGFLYTLKKKAAGFSETPIHFYKAKHRHALADSNFSVYCLKNSQTDPLCVKCLFVLG
jgi:hypothetical protein